MPKRRRRPPPDSSQKRVGIWGQLRRRSWGLN
nr:unnamed protein product [Digitaria exilis]